MTDKHFLDWKDKEWVYEQWCNGYTQGEIADAIGCNIKTIQRFLCKKQKIKKTLVYKRKEKTNGKKGKTQQE